MSVICVFCREQCQPAPTARGWSTVRFEEGLHFDCARKVAFQGDILDAKEGNPSPLMIAIEKIEALTIKAHPVAIKGFSNCRIEVLTILRQLLAMEYAPIPVNSTISKDRLNKAIDEIDALQLKSHFDPCHNAGAGIMKTNVLIILNQLYGPDLREPFVQYPEPVDWTAVIEGKISVPDELDPLVNSVGNQILMHTISEKNQTLTVCHIVYKAQKFFWKMYCQPNARKKDAVELGPDG